MKFLNNAEEFAESKGKYSEFIELYQKYRSYNGTMDSCWMTLSDLFGYEQACHIEDISRRDY